MTLSTIDAFQCRAAAAYYNRKLEPPTDRMWTILLLMVAGY